MALSTNLIQIEEFELVAGNTDIVYTTSGGLDNSLIGIYCDKYGVYPVDERIENNSLHITYEPQTTTIHVAVLFIKGDLTINNTLTSNSETEALSAKQGKELKDLIDNIQVTGALSDLDDVDLSSLSGGDVLVYDSVNQKWVNSKMISCDIITNTSGQFSTITGGLLQSCDITLTPIQSGSGTPSPQNVRPITGHSSVEVDVCGKNRLPNVATSTSGRGIDFVVNSDGTIDTNGQATQDVSMSVYNDTLPMGNYILNGVSGGSDSTYAMRYRLNGGSWVGNYIYSGDSAVITLTDTDVIEIQIRIYSGVRVDHVLFKPMLRISTETDATFEPYNSTDHTIPLGQTVYGGSLDVVSGSGSDEWVNIASYNGETITEPWLSSMDEYVSGGTPTTGAQVVYKKATATSFSTTPTQIETLIGENNVSVPLTGQSLDSLSYREVMAWDDVEKAIPTSSNIDYSTSEQDTGLKWIDGKTIYQVVIDVSSSPINIPYNSWVNIGLSGASQVLTVTVLCEGGLVEMAFECRAFNGYLQVQRVGQNSGSSRSLTHLIATYIK